MKSLFKTIFVVFFVFSLFSLAHGKVKYIPIEDMPAMADFVIMGMVIDSNSRWDDRKIMIFTDYTILVEENILGYSPSKIVMSFAGGTVGEKTIIVTETPVLKIGERYVLFAHESGKYSVPVVGHEQGVFRVVYDKVKKGDFIVDYNWYQLEITNERQIIRGPLTEVDPQGALILRKVEEKAKAEDQPRPVIRDPSGKEIPQDYSVFTKPKIRKRGNPVAKSEFVDFIRAQIGGRGDKK